jgi:hypothetical protein
VVDSGERSLRLVARTDDTTCYAANWRTVLAVDAGLGLVALLAGLVLALTLTVVGGVVLAVAGAAYASLVAVRARRWARLRREAGL